MNRGIRVPTDSQVSESVCVGVWQVQDAFRLMSFTAGHFANNGAKMKK